MKDSSGPVLSGVTVTLISSALPDKSRSTTTDNTGQYAFTDLPEGYYYISFALAGFTTVERPPFRLLATFNARIDAALQKATPQ